MRFPLRFFDRVDAMGHWNTLVALAVAWGFGAEVERCKPREHASLAELRKANEKLGNALIERVKQTHIEGSEK